MTDTHMLVCKSGMLSVCMCALRIYCQEALSCGSVESPGVEELAALSPLSLLPPSLLPLTARPASSLPGSPVYHVVDENSKRWRNRLSIPVGAPGNTLAPKTSPRQKELHLQSQNTLHLSATNEFVLSWKHFFCTCLPLRILLNRDSSLVVFLHLHRHWDCK